MTLHDESPTIVACPDGPLLVRGAVHLETPEGEPIEQHRRTVALCRCGVSTIKPFCDGTHKAIHFKTDPQPAPGRPSEREE
jgi:CDGSH-type Zn-finger protein